MGRLDLLVAFLEGYTKEGIEKRGEKGGRGKEQNGEKCREKRGKGKRRGEKG